VGVIIVFDLTSMESFNNIKCWIDECEMNMDAGYKTIILGNNSELPQNVPQKSINEISSKHHIDYFAVSATDRESIMEALHKLIAIMPKYTYKEKLDILEPSDNRSFCC